MTGPYAGWHSFRWATSPGDPDPRVLVGTDPSGREWAVGEVVPRAWRDGWFVELLRPDGRRYLERRNVATPTIGRGLLEQWVLAAGGRIGDRRTTAPAFQRAPRRPRTWAPSRQALDVIESLRALDGSTVDRLSEETGRPVGALRTILDTLERHGLVVRADRVRGLSSRGPRSVLWRVA